MKVFMLALLVGWLSIQAFADNTAIFNFGEQKSQIINNYSSDPQIEKRLLMLEGKMQKLGESQRRLSKKIDSYEKSTTDKSNLLIDKQVANYDIDDLLRRLNEIDTKSSSKATNVSSIHIDAKLMLSMIEESENKRADISEQLSTKPDVLDEILGILIDQTESMEDSKEKQYWHEMLPKMTTNQKIRLFDILSIERYKLAELDRKYLDEIRSLDRKHRTEWIALQRKKLDKNEPTVVLEFATSLIENGGSAELQEAIELLQNLKSKKYKPKTNYMLALAFYKQRKLAEAIKSLSKSIDAESTNPEYRALLGKIYLQQNDKNKALSELALAFKYDTKDIDAIYKYSRLLSGIKKYKIAEDILMVAINKDNKNDILLSEMANILKAQKKFSEAKRYIDDALQSNPKSQYAYSTLGWWNYEQHKYGDAEIAFKEALLLDKTDHNALMQIGLSQIEQGKTEQALKSIANALKVAITEKASEKDEAEIKLGIAAILANNGNIEEAKEIITRQVKKNTERCSLTYMSEHRNWHTNMLDLLKKQYKNLCQ